jgi:hypothetical protein
LLLVRASPIFARSLKKQECFYAQVSTESEGSLFQEHVAGSLVHSEKEAEVETQQSDMDWNSECFYAQVSTEREGSFVQQQVPVVLLLVNSEKNKEVEMQHLELNWYK